MKVASPSSGAVAERVLEILGTGFSPIIARSILRAAMKQAGISAARLEREGVTARLLTGLNRGLRMHTRDRELRRTCGRQLEALVGGGRPAGPELGAEQIRVDSEQDIVAARHKARLLAADLGFDGTTRIKIVTTVSELARNMFRYAGGGSLHLRSISHPRRGLQVIAEDEGPGIADLDTVLAGRYQSRTGMGMGLLGCKRLMDEFEVRTGPEGTRVSAHKFLSERGVRR